MKALIKHTGLHLICDEAAERLYTDDQASENPEENCCRCTGHDCMKCRFEQGDGRRCDKPVYSPDAREGSPYREFCGDCLIYEFGKGE